MSFLVTIDGLIESVWDEGLMMHGCWEDSFTGDMNELDELSALYE